MARATKVLNLGPIFEEDFKLIDDAAKIAGKSRRGYCIDLLVADAKRVIAEEWTKA